MISDGISVTPPSLIIFHGDGGAANSDRAGLVSEEGARNCLRGSRSLSVRSATHGGLECGGVYRGLTQLDAEVCCEPVPQILGGEIVQRCGGQGGLELSPATSCP